MKKKKGYTHLIKEERSEIEILLSKGYSRRSIARVLGRSVSTVSREIERNGAREQNGSKKGELTGEYKAKLAQMKSSTRRKNSKFQGRKIWENKELRRYIEEGLKKGWSPDVISGRMKLEEQPFYASKTTIYEFLYSSYGQYLCKYLPSRRYKRKRRKKKSKQKRIPGRVSIRERPVEAGLKLEYGHFEGDTIVSGKRTGSRASLSVLYARKAKYTAAVKISSLKPEENNKALKKMSSKLKGLKSFTLDNGVENTRQKELKKELDIDIYFCDPYSSWQKGGVENANRLIRRYIPKGEDIDHYSQKEIKEICDRINNIPRRSLGYKTPLEVMIENNLLMEGGKRNKKPPVGGVEIKKLIHSDQVGVALEG